jgi:hypothetical protein
LATCGKASGNGSKSTRASSRNGTTMRMIDEAT